MSVTMSEAFDYSMIDNILSEHGTSETAIIAILQSIQEEYHVSEALGATVKWNANIRTVYIDMNGDVAPSPEPTGGTVKYYDGIAFNDVTDVDQYGRIKVEKLKEFLLKLADQLRFVKENGKYYIECTYPEKPEGYEWGLGIRVSNKDGTYITYSQVGRNPKWLIPSEGAFKRKLQILLI